MHKIVSRGDMKQIVVHFIPHHNQYIQELLVRLSLIKNIKVDIETEKYVSMYISILSDYDETYDNLIVIIASFILRIYKTRFFEKNAKISSALKVCKNALIKSLVSFDFENELFYLSSIIDGYKNIFPESTV